MNDPTAIAVEVVPLPYHPELVPKGKIVHRGIFSNDLKQYYITISDTAFSNFSVLVSQQVDGRWTEPEPAFFNTEYNEHGMSFSPDGQTLFYSSTRALQGEKDGIWRIFRQEANPGVKTYPRLIEMRGMDAKHLLHPSQSPDGTLYFQASNLDYSSTGLYYAKKGESGLLEAHKLEFDSLKDKDLCTPYVSADGQYLFFATVGPQLDLYYCNSIGENEWSAPIKLSEAINQNGQGNPYLTPDNQYLFYASENGESGWQINWIKTDTFLKP